MFQETFKNFKINFNALNATATFSSGDFLTGQIFFDIAKKTKITSITMLIKGKAKVLWTTRSGSGRRRRTRTHSARLEFFNFAIGIMQPQAVGPTELQPGTHAYPFTCQLPPGNFPSSFRGVHGSIIYSMKVEIQRPWHLAKEFLTEFNFASYSEANHPQLLAPMDGSNSTMLGCLWCASGPITMTARLERKGFTPGETIRILCEFSNATSKNATPKASLVQYQKFYSSGGSTKHYEKSLVSVAGPPVNGGSPETYSEVTLSIPPDTARSISNCSILEVQYNVLVRLCVSYSSDLTVVFPIILCNIPTPEPPPQY